MTKPLAILAVLTALGLPAWADGLSARFPAYPGLEQGRQVWLDICRDCHANPLGSAPQVKDKAVWVSRLAKGRPALLQSTLHGFTGDTGDFMPPKGGISSLTDDQAVSALDYMLKLVSMP